MTDDRRPAGDSTPPSTGSTGRAPRAARRGAARPSAGLNQHAPVERTMPPSTSRPSTSRMTLVMAPSVAPQDLPDPGTVLRALPRPLRQRLQADGWSLDHLTPQGTLVWRRSSNPSRPIGWIEADHWALRKAIRAYGLGTHPLGHDGLGMVMFKATPFVVARAIDRARTDHTFLFDAHGRLPSAALIVGGRLAMPPVKRVDTRWHDRLLVEPLDITRSETPQELGQWLRHAFAESGINPYPEADLNEVDGLAGPYDLAFPVLEALARSVGLAPLAALLRAAHRRMKAWAVEQDAALHAEWARLEQTLTSARR